jgi:hypothetical protein
LYRFIVTHIGTAATDCFIPCQTAQNPDTDLSVDFVNWLRNKTIVFASALTFTAKRASAAGKVEIGSGRAFLPNHDILFAYIFTRG